MRAFILLTLATVVLAQAEETYPTKPDKKELDAFREPDLSSSTKRPFSQEFRFIWMRSFHSPIAIRAFSDSLGAKLRIVRLDGKGGYDIGKINLSKTVDIKKEEWEQLRLISKKPKARNPLNGMTELQKYSLHPKDGATWSLEVRYANTYSFEMVPSPLSLGGFNPKTGEDLDDPDVRDFIVVCKKLLALAKVAEPNLFEEEHLY